MAAVSSRGKMKEHDFPEKKRIQSPSQLVAELEVLARRKRVATPLEVANNFESDSIVSADEFGLVEEEDRR